MSNLDERSLSQQPLLNSTDNLEETTESTTGRVSQFVNNVNINNIIQSNSFLQSDLNNLVTTEPVNRTMSQETVLNVQANNNNSPNAEGVEATSSNESTEQAQANTPTSFIPFVVSSLQSSLPFFILLIAKIFHQHLLGFFIVLGFMTTLHWSNRNFVHQVELREKKQNKKLILLVLFLLLNVTVFFIIFNDYKLYNCLVFISPNVKKMDTWNLIWIVVCSDTIIKFLTISFKALITILPFKVMPLRKRGSYYSLIESGALFYRSLTPIHPWILFLFYADQTVEMTSGDKPGSDIPFQNRESTTFLVFLCIFYTVCKLNQLYSLVKDLRVSYKEMKEDMVSLLIYLTLFLIKY